MKMYAETRAQLRARKKHLSSGVYWSTSEPAKNRYRNMRNEVTKRLCELDASELRWRCSQDSRATGADWRPVSGYEGLFCVSSDGRIMSRRGIRSLVMGKDGRYRIRLDKNGKSTAFSVHRLVIEAFIGPCPDGYECNHKNGIKADNRSCNLEWTTRHGNIAHAFASGLMAIGSRNGRAKLSEADIPVIRSLIGRISIEKIAERFGVSPHPIYKIRDGQTWQHVPREGV